MRRLLLFLFLLILAAGGWTAYLLLAPYKGFSGSGIIVDVPKGDSVRGIARLLEQQGVIRNRYSFILLARRSANRKLEAGEYYFTQPQTPSQVFDTIASGRIFEVSITVPEGFNTLQIAELLSQNALVDKDEFIAATKDISSIRDFAPAAPSVEGFLFPSTYEFPHHVSAQEVIATMTAHFRAEWASLTAVDPASDGRSVQQVVTLASLVESETPKQAERPLVARVFLNRLKIGLPMQCDPTVIYALELAGKYDPPLTSADLRYDSSYNTYRHPGLPPGPITNPGEASLRAALVPAAVDYLYFVADTQGGHLFSSTLAEHNRNVARYRQLLSQHNGRNPAPSHNP
ncbi:MAG TPA: endolytic transglycosylase MltG [Candidatus Acidoferrales bacterium]|nr:endolytic transglycosylase MltG [Candidatus Acidoferrales bacterium]